MFFHSLELLVGILLMAWVVLDIRKFFKSSKKSAQTTSAALEERVLLITRNRGAMERAVTAKRRQHPDLNRRQLLELVYQDYLRDRS